MKLNIIIFVFVLFIIIGTIMIFIKNTNTPNPTYTNTPNPTYTNTPNPTYTNTPNPNYISYKINNFRNKPNYDILLYVILGQSNGMGCNAGIHNNDLPFKCGEVIENSFIFVSSKSDYACRCCVKNNPRNCRQKEISYAKEVCGEECNKDNLDVFQPMKMSINNRGYIPNPKVNGGEQRWCGSEGSSPVDAIAYYLNKIEPDTDHYFLNCNQSNKGLVDSCWSIDKDNECYDQAKRDYETAIEKLKDENPGKTVGCGAIIWIQGEFDMNSKYSNEYLSEETKLIEAFRQLEGAEDAPWITVLLAGYAGENDKANIINDQKLLNNETDCFVDASPSRFQPQTSWNAKVHYPPNITSIIGTEILDCILEVWGEDPLTNGDRKYPESPDNYNYPEF